MANALGETQRVQTLAGGMKSQQIPFLWVSHPRCLNQNQVLCQDVEDAWSLRLAGQSELAWHRESALRAPRAVPHPSQTPLLGDAGSEEDEREVRSVFRERTVQQHHVSEERAVRLPGQSAPVCAACPRWSTGPRRHWWLRSRPLPTEWHGESHSEGEPNQKFITKI